MTQEQLRQITEIVQKMNQCQKALDYLTHGTYHYYGQDARFEYCTLPDEVCAEIRQVISKYRNEYAKEFKAL